MPAHIPRSIVSTIAGLWMIGLHNGFDSPQFQFFIASNVKSVSAKMSADPDRQRIVSGVLSSACPPATRRKIPIITKHNPFFISVHQYFPRFPIQKCACCRVAQIAIFPVFLAHFGNRNGPSLSNRPRFWASPFGEGRVRGRRVIFAHFPWPGFSWSLLI